jgi:tRNA-splicing ligase RtcB
MSDRSRVRRWVAEPLEEGVEAALGRLSLADDVEAIAVMPDVHLAGDVCIGTVLATRRLLYPAAVGGDIGCGMAAIRFDGAVCLDNPRTAHRVLAGFGELVPVIKHRSKVSTDEGLWSRTLSCDFLRRLRDREGRVQLGTLGRGNHFLELQMDEVGQNWLMVHSGSRRMGQRIRDHHLSVCDVGRMGFRYLASDTDQGRAYLSDVDWALGYATENRRRILRAAAEVVETVTGARAEPSTRIECHHNHVEMTGAATPALWIHRKGAISAKDGEPGIIPGSMGTPSFHVRGRGNADALWSSSHGAGRVMSRSAARAKISTAALERQAKGVIFDRRIAHRLVDEAPAAYKDISKVMRAQRALTCIVRRLDPVLSYKGT